MMEVFDNFGSWPPVISVLAITLIALKLVLDHIVKRKNGSGLPESSLIKLSSTLEALNIAMSLQTDVLRRVAEETHDLHQWHDHTDPNTGMKRWYTDPSVKADIDDLHTWALKDRAAKSSHRGD